MTATSELPAHLLAALADPDQVPELTRVASAAYEDSVREGNSPRVQQGLAALAAQAAVALLRLGLLEGRVHLALGSGQGAVAEARPLPAADALTWIDAWYLTWIANRPDVREELHRLRHLLVGDPAALAWVDVLGALDGRHPDRGAVLGAAERTLPPDSPERALLPAAAALLLDDDPERLPATGWGARALTAFSLRSR